MDLGGRRRSTNVDDRRGQSVGPGGMGGGLNLGLMNLLFSLFASGRGGGGKLILILLILFFVLRPLFFSGAPREPETQQRAPIETRSPQETRDRLGEPGSQTAGRYAYADDEELKDMLLVVLASTEDVWRSIFAEHGMKYKDTTLVFFTDYVQSACGMNSAATGPFYCPGDQKVYMDLSFFRELSQRFGAKGDGAIAYVLAHEVGHHVQNQLGIMQEVDKYRRTASKTQMNQLTVRLELQADYFAGVWAHYAGKEGLFEPEDADEAIEAALAIGDDRLQMQSQGRVTPENFTHGTSEQRQRWFARGYEHGDIEHGDTFSLDYQELAADGPHEALRTPFFFDLTWLLDSASLAR